MYCKTLLLIATITAITMPAQARECIPTAHRTTGTHYEPVTEQKVNVSKGVLIQGQVLNAACQPVANAKVAHWQAGENGRYSDKLRAYLFTDKNGYYQFETEWPNLNPPHIHFIVSAQGYEVLETQWIGHTPIKNIQFDMVLDAK